MKPLKVLGICGSPRKGNTLFLLEKALEAHGILYAFPVYHMSIPGQLKCLIDRLGQSGSYLHDTPVRRLKIIGAIAQGKHLYGGQDFALSFIIHHTVLMRCIPVAGEGWNSYIGSGGWAFDMRERNAIRNHFNAGNPYAVLLVEAAGSIGQRAVELANIVRSGMLAKKEKYSKDPGYLPFLDDISET